MVSPDTLQDTRPPSWLQVMVRDSGWDELCPWPSCLQSVGIFRHPEASVLGMLQGAHGGVAPASQMNSFGD